jgi:diacylglycerol kinase family enzyme/membrane-associated phospholipid phosphatase
VNRRQASVLDRLGQADLAAFQAVAGRHTPLLDHVLPRLTRSANHGLLWWGVAAGLGATRGTRRRGAVRGLLALGIASGVANIPAKLSVQRPRPSLEGVPLTRRLMRQPTTTSFPSGHSASAAAFATGVAMESPLAGAAVGVIAGAVAYSRVYVGVHYPGDVAAGIALGMASAAVTAKTWPRRPDRPARTRPANSDAPALPDGDGLVVVVNAGAGKASRGDVSDELRRLLPKVRIVEPGEHDDLVEVMTSAAEGARVLGVAGGDGTVNCAAAVALRADMPLAVFPAGTLDHFARELGLDELSDTVDAVKDGRAGAVDVGWLANDADDPDDAIFLNTASLGSYPELVTVREHLETYLGKWPAMFIGSIRVLRHGEPMEIRVDGRPRKVWLLFAGNGGYRPSGFAPTYRPNLDDGLLDVRILDAQHPYARTRLVLALMSGRLGRSKVYEQRYAETLDIERRDAEPTLPFARDGEVGDQAPKLRLRKFPRRLVVYRAAQD